MKKKILVGLLIITVMNIIPIVYGESTITSWSVVNATPHSGQSYYNIGVSSAIYLNCRIDIEFSNTYWHQVFAKWSLIIDDQFKVSGEEGRSVTGPDDYMLCQTDYNSVSGFTFGQHNYYFAVELFEREWLYEEYNVSMGTKQTNVCLFYTYEFTNIDITTELITPENYESFPYEQELANFTYAVNVTVNGGVDYEISLISHLGPTLGIVNVDSYKTVIGNNLYDVGSGFVEISDHYDVGINEITIFIDHVSLKRDGGYYNAVRDKPYGTFYFYREEKVVPTPTPTPTTPSETEETGISLITVIFGIIIIPVIIVVLKKKKTLSKIRGDKI